MPEGEGTVLARVLRRNKPEPAKVSGKWRNPIPVFRSEAASPMGELQPGRGTWNRMRHALANGTQCEGHEQLPAKVNGVGPQAASFQQEASQVVFDWSA